MPKKTQKTVLTSQSREFVIRLRDYFERERENGGTLLPVSQVIERVSDALGIGRNTVSRITREKFGASTSEENKLSTPTKKRPRKAPITDVDNFAAEAIRNHIYNYYERKELPTILKMMKSLKDADLFAGSATSLWRLLKDIGFRFKKINKRKIIMERGDIALARVTFLKKAKMITDWRNVVFLDETWLNANHTVGKMWTDDTAHASTKVPEGKGERLIICHAGTTNGFVSNSLLAFKSKKTGEYHEDMNAEVFTEWFQNMLNNLEEPSTIIMDNAPYHSVQLNKAPTSSNKKKELVEWLQANNVEADETLLKVELVKLVKMHKPKPPIYKLDEMARECGHEVIRLPPYHCQYNAIELIWAQIKGFAARNNTAPPFTSTKMMNLLEEACTTITADDWKKVVEKTKNLILHDWERDIRIDNVLESQIIIYVSEESSDSSDSSSDEEMDDE